MSPRPERNPAVIFFGWLLMGIGGLIAVTAGACSLYFVVSMLGNGAGGPDGFVNVLFMTLIFGGIPIAVGAALIFAGRAISRPRVTRRD